MLAEIYDRKDIANIIHHPYNKLYAHHLLVEAAKVDNHAEEAIYTILTDAGWIPPQIY
ncbi:hypothetical protein [Cardinium endosymbiont of Sogatella furcifera]|uniref:hypothetical protein n=1 Tax=Cardinium endosymbiont of Sogatella furcifera TaxID=650378 RepID=UPI0013B37916|nr:hypothetical protein [Cardinium endosymbiont of Sogatella furcifera]